MAGRRDLAPDAPHPPADVYALEAAEALSHLASSEHGLDARAVDERLARFGPNRLPRRGRIGPLRRFLRQFANLLLQLLIAASAISLLLGHWLDAAVIAVVVLINAVIGFLQEGRAQRALEAIGDLIAPRASVRRERMRIDVDAEAVVPGDILFIEPGDRIAADARVIVSKGLKVQEAALTGESVAVEKSARPCARGASLAERASMVHAGTLVVAGQGLAVVSATGALTEIGRIGAALASAPSMETPLLREIGRFGRLQTAVVLGLAAVAFAAGVLIHQQSAQSLFMAIVSIAVAAIPEGLPTILTVTLAIGVAEMARRNAVIRRLPAVEALGAVSVICTDKTGTLTRNEMTVTSLAMRGVRVAIAGEGYAPIGAMSVEGARIDPAQDPRIRLAGRIAALCNDASLAHAADGQRPSGDPMEAALLAFAGRAGVDVDAERGAWLRLDAIPFDAELRFMATLDRGPDGDGIVSLKGAPEQVLARSARELDRDQTERPLDAEAWRAEVERLAADGQRVMALAWRPAEETDLAVARLGNDFCLVGLVGLSDPPREDAKAVIAECVGAGIAVKMITGDHATTARAIGRRLGLDGAQVLTGQDIDRLSDAELTSAVETVDVFARADPIHKVRLVEAFRTGGRRIAMTGDGVNDALALTRADVGVAMGRSGTEAAKEAAEIVLLDDSFASIAAAVRQGRVVYDNLKKAIVFLLPINGGEALSLVGAILVGATLPISPLQILWVNMVSSLALALTLAFEPEEPGLMARPPRPANAALLDGFLWWRIGLVSTLFSAGIFGGFYLALAAGLGVEGARTVAVNTLVAMEVWYLFSVRYLAQPSFTLRGVRGTPAVLLGLAAVIALQAIFTYAPPMRWLFDTTPLEPIWLAFAAAVGALVFALLEIEKLLLRRARVG